MAGERKQQILETLAKMLEAPKREKITTAGFAAFLINEDIFTSGNLFGLG